MAQVTLTDVTKRYGDVEAVHRVSLEIPDQELVVLVGPSGCGKSTTLRMVAGLEEISEGEIRIGERVVNDVPPKDRDIAMVFQSYALYPHMSVRRNLEFGLKMRGTSRQEIDRAVQEAAGILGIETLLDRKPRQLSGGQRQRVAMGRALVRRPEVFLFDEPLSNLDAALRVQMRTEISRLHSRLKTTTIYVTHDQVEAMTLADRIVVMRDGVVQQVGPPLELYDRPANRFVAGFIGTPAMNFVEGRLAGPDDAPVFATDGIKLAIPGRFKPKLKELVSSNLVLGIRPQDVEIGPSDGSGNGNGTLSAQVEVVEPLGSEVFLYLASAWGELVARTSVDSAKQVREGDRVSVQLLGDRLHLFDGSTDWSLLA